MSLEDGLAQGEPDAQAPAVVSRRISAGIEQIEDMRFLIIRDPGPVIFHADPDLPVLFSGPDPDTRTRLRIFHRVIQQVQDDLNDQPGISPDKEKLIRLSPFENKRIQAFSKMTDCFADQVIHQFCSDIEIEFAFVHAAGGEQVFNHAGQPLRVIIDIVIYLGPGRRIQRFPAGNQIISVSHDACQRGAKVVGNSPEQIGPEAFVFGKQDAFFFFPGVPGILQCQGAFTDNRGQHALL